MAGLPDGFAERVLELELNIQSDSCDVPAIEELISLYSVSICDTVTNFSKRWSTSMTWIPRLTCHRRCTDSMSNGCRTWCSVLTSSSPCSRSVSGNTTRSSTGPTQRGSGRGWGRMLRSLDRYTNNTHASRSKRLYKVSTLTFHSHRPQKMIQILDLHKYWTRRKPYWR